MKLVFILTILKVALINGYVDAAQIVNTTDGAVQGTTLLSRNGREISAFLGIPYAKSDQSLRFKASPPPEKWSGVRDGKSYGPYCPQIVFSPFQTSNFETTGDEDCLSINVFTPTNTIANTSKAQDLLPVLVFIHGGYFTAFSGSHWGPRYLLDHDMLFVTFNYRLGIFGFLGVPDAGEDAPGNTGMYDQVKALNWVQDNIRNFGGDPNRVTIYGESAGAAAIHYHLLSDLSKGLFSAAISGSGTAFKVLSVQLSPQEAAEKAASELGCGASIGNNTEMIACLRSVDASKIAAISDEFTKVLKDPLRLFAPLIEPTDNSNNSFITQHPYEIERDGLQNTVPWMVGVNSGEGLIIAQGAYQSEEWPREINNNWMNGLASKFLIYNESDTDLTNSINDFYLNTSGTNGSIDFRRDIVGFTNLFSDRLYIHASLEAVRLQAQKSPVYLYYNDYMTYINTIGIGTNHGEELLLIFSPQNFSDPMIDEGHQDFEQSKAIVSVWAQFITDPHNVYYNNQLWKPVEPAQSLEESPDCLVLRNSNRGEQGVSKLPQDVVDRVNFWNLHGVPAYQDYEL